MPATKKPRASGIFEQPTTKALDITLSANRIATNKPGLNPYELRNDVLIEEEKTRICAANGVAAAPKPRKSPRPYARYDAKGLTRADKGYTADQLEGDADREGANHRRTLDRNLGKSGFVRVPNVCAHHIVASGHPDASGSRQMLYAWRIGINDADNGVFLPARRGLAVPTLKDAVQHDDLHADALYYALVERRLMLADEGSQVAGREALRDMRGEMIRGTFPVART
ncbi:MAG: AHH domain-containing protein [Pseudomonadota bacterium]|nr:AHH domain-containing protein [Pseudomonadota bacterium]